MSEELNEVRFAETHTPIFLAGTNLAAKLDPSKRPDLSLFYDFEGRRLIVKLKEHIAYVPESNVAYFIEGKPERPGAVKAAPAAVVQGKIQAQVSGPQHHVFAGPGAGKR